MMSFKTGTFGLILMAYILLSIKTGGNMKNKCKGCKKKEQEIIGLQEEIERIDKYRRNALIEAEVWKDRCRKLEKGKPDEN